MTNFFTKPYRHVASSFMLSLSIVGCSPYFKEQKANDLLAKGQTADGMHLWQQLNDQNPIDYRLKYIRTRDQLTQKLLAEAQKAQRQAKLDDALNRYSDILQYDPQHAAALRGIDLIARQQRQDELFKQAQAAVDTQDNDRALTLLNEILTENPEHVDARQLKQHLDLLQNRVLLNDPTLKDSLRKPVSLEFKNANIQAIFDVLAQSAGINFIFDKDVKTDLRTTIYARNTSIEDALNLILRTNQLSKKALNDSTLLIYPDTPDKTKQYEDLIIRSFYLGAADPKKLQDMIRTMVSPKSMYVDDKLRLLVVRDSLNVITTIEKLVAAYDIADPEVVLDVEILEVSSDSLLNIGIQYPNQISASVSGAAAKAGQLTIDEIKNLNRNNYKLTVPDPIATVNLKQTSGSANMLANPKIRVRNREKAKVLIGDKVPVITTTTNQTSSSVSESVSYLDVGLKLEVEPEIHVNNDVSIIVGLEVSNIIKEVKSTTGLLTYQIGTRNANTVLRLKDGETQMLAGLIKDEQRESASHFPGLGKLPILGKLFSNDSNTKTKSEIILLITPHVVRSLNTPNVAGLEFASGTGEEVSVQPFRLKQAAKYSASNAKVMDSPKVNPSNPAETNNSKSSTSLISNAPSSSESTANESNVSSIAEPEMTEPLTLDNSDAVDANSPRLQLDMVAPAQIPANKEFTLALLSNGPEFEQWDFDLDVGQIGLEVVRANAVAPTANFSYSQQGQSIHFTFGSTPSHNGPLVMLTLKATQASSQPVQFKIDNSVAKKANNKKLPTMASSRQITITP